MAMRIAKVLRNAAGGGVTNRMLLSMGSPSQSIYLKKPVDSVTIPGTEGTFTLTNNHSLIVSQISPGVITVRDGADSEDYFISDGFVFFNQSSDGSGCCTAEISAVEVVPTSALDKDRAAQVLSDVLSGPKDTAWAQAKVSLGSNLVNQVIKAAQ